MPFFPQEEHQCGPAALATVLGWSGVSVAPAALAPSAYVPQREGSFQAELLTAARRQGRLAYVIQPDLAALLREVASGHPVLILQNRGLPWFPLWHYAVVVGFDVAGQTAVLRSGTERRREIPFATFDTTWARAGRWGVVVLRPGELPATADERRYVDAVLGLERVQRWPDANEAYRAARTKWPLSLPLLLGIGNTYYQMEDRRAAEQAFREAIGAHPRAGVAHNNLAQVLADLGRIPEAIDAAQRAVALGGPLRDDFSETLREIERHAQ